MERFASSDKCLPDRSLLKMPTAFPKHCQQLKQIEEHTGRLADFWGSGTCLALFVVCTSWPATADHMDVILGNILVLLFLCGIFCLELLHICLQHIHTVATYSEA